MSAKGVKRGGNNKDDTRPNKKLTYPSKIGRLFTFVDSTFSGDMFFLRMSKFKWGEIVSLLQGFYIPKAPVAWDPMIHAINLYNSITHRIHVPYMYLHLVVFLG